MGTVSDKINYLNGTKNAIKNAIVAKGVSIGNSDTFRSYAQKIGLIQTSSSEDGGTDINLILSGQYITSLEYVCSQILTGYYMYDKSEV